jgi:cytochrome c
VTITFDYLPQGHDKTLIAQGHQRPEMPGKILMAESDCKTCHQIDEKSAGPSYRDVAKKYKRDPQAIELLSNKVISGGAGVWGETPMAAHPQITKENSMLIVEYILSLANQEGKKTLPVEGTVQFNPPPSAAGTIPKGAYILTASYDDKGNGVIPSLSGEKAVVLRVPYLGGADVAEFNGPRKLNTPNGDVAVEGIKHGGSLTYKGIDLSGIHKMQFSIAEVAIMSKGGTIDVFLDAPGESTKLGTVNFENSPKVSVMTGVSVRTAGINLKDVSGLHDLVLVFNNPEAGDGDLFYFAGISLEK